MFLFNSSFIIAVFAFTCTLCVIAYLTGGNRKRKVITAPLLSNSTVSLRITRKENKPPDLPYLGGEPFIHILPQEIITKEILFKYFYTSQENLKVLRNFSLVSKKCAKLVRLLVKEKKENFVLVKDFLYTTGQENLIELHRLLCFCFEYLTSPYSSWKQKSSNAIEIDPELIENFKQVYPQTGWFDLKFPEMNLSLTSNDMRHISDLINFYLKFSLALFNLDEFILRLTSKGCHSCEFINLDSDEKVTVSDIITYRTIGKGIWSLLTEENELPKVDVYMLDNKIFSNVIGSTLMKNKVDVLEAISLEYLRELNLHKRYFFAFRITMIPPHKGALIYCSLMDVIRVVFESKDHIDHYLHYQSTVFKNHLFQTMNQYKISPEHPFYEYSLDEVIKNLRESEMLSPKNNKLFFKKTLFHPPKKIN